VIEVQRVEVGAQLCEPMSANKAAVIWCAMILASAYLCGLVTVAVLIGRGEYPLSILSKGARDLLKVSASATEKKTVQPIDPPIRHASANQGVSHQQIKDVSPQR